MRTPNGDKPCREMSKRELIACAALEGYLASSDSSPHPDFAAGRAEEFADALLARLGDPTPAPAPPSRPYPDYRAAAVAALNWLRVGAPLRALEVLEEVLKA